MKRAPADRWSDRFVTRLGGPALIPPLRLGAITTLITGIAGIGVVPRVQQAEASRTARSTTSMDLAWRRPTPSTTALPTTGLAAAEAPAAGAGTSSTARLPRATTTSTTSTSTSRVVRRPSQPTTTAAPTTTTAAPVRDGVVRRSGTGLVLDGATYRSVGFVAPQATTLWSVNWGCGAQMADGDLDAMFAALPPKTMVSIWAPQALAFNNKSTNAIDFTGIDRVVRAAEAHGQLLDLQLGHQAGYCDDWHWKDRAWYSGGYKQAYSDDGRNITPLSYWDYIHQIVPRYKDSPAVAMWTPINEAESSDCGSGKHGADCYGNLTCAGDAAAVLRRFFDVVGAEIKKMDPVHLLSTGTVGTGQCGARGSDYVTLHQSPAVDVCEIHSYEPSGLTPTGPGTTVGACLDAGKVPVVGELGQHAGKSDCRSLTARRDDLSGVVGSYRNGGAAVVLLWQWVPGGPEGCGLGVAASDPLVAWVRAHGRA